MITNVITKSITPTSETVNPAGRTVLPQETDVAPVPEDIYCIERCNDGVWSSICTECRHVLPEAETLLRMHLHIAFPFPSHIPSQKYRIGVRRQ